MVVEVFYTEGKFQLSENSAKDEIFRELNEEGVLTISFTAFQGPTLIVYPTPHTKMGDAISDTEEAICRYIVRETGIKQELHPIAATQSSTQTLPSGTVGVERLVFQAQVL